MKANMGSDFVSLCGNFGFGNNIDNMKGKYSPEEAEDLVTAKSENIDSTEGVIKIEMGKVTEKKSEESLILMKN